MSVARLDRALIEKTFGSQPLVVVNGPFKGMKYLRLSSGSALMPKLVGSYEMELHPTLEEIIQSEYDRILNIGCAEGYYAVGLALRMPRPDIHGFELNAAARERCRQLAELNGLSDRINIHGLCTPDDLVALTKPRTLIVCDCEGAELELLDPARVHGLLQADILVEIHDFIDPRISSAIFERFDATHRIRMISSTKRHPAAFPALRSLSPREQLFALEEFRPGTMEWAFIQYSRILSPRREASQGS
jgi:hypothetical protein